MKIAIDITPSVVSKAGIGYHTFELTKAIIHNYKNDEIYLLANSLKSFADYEIIIKDNQNVKKMIVESSKPGFFWIIKSIFKLRREKISILISTSNFLFGILRRNTVQLIHDIAPIKTPQYFTKKGVIMFWILFNIYIRLGKVSVTNCKTTFDETTKYYPRVKNRLSIAGIGIHEWTKQKPDKKYYDEIRQKYDLPENYFISLGTIEPRKNHLNMAKAFIEFNKIHSDFEYLIVGKKGWKNNEILDFLENSENKEKIKIIGYIPEEDIAGLVDQSRALLMVSFYEGFGLPAVEAFARNKQIVVSDIKVFREIFDNSVYFANPSNPIDILSKLSSVINKPLKYNSDKTDKSNWENVAIRTVKSLKL